MRRSVEASVLGAARQPVWNSVELGRIIRARRKKLGYTQVQIAAMMGVSPRLIGEIERGRGTVAVQTVLDLCTGLGIDLFPVGRGESQ